MSAPDPAPGLARVILSCLEKDPKDRPQSMLELARMLEPFCSETGRLHARRIARIATLDAIDTVPHLALANAPRRRSQRTSWQRQAAIGGAICLVAALVAIVAVVVPAVIRSPTSQDARNVRGSSDAVASSLAPITSASASASPSASASSWSAAASSTPRSRSATKAPGVPGASQDAGTSAYDDRF